MAENVIAIILPEYDDKDNLITSDEWKRNALLDDDVMGKCIKELAQFVDFFSDEECEMIYDPKNVSAFSYTLRTIPEYYPSRESQLRMALKGTTNWRAAENRVSDEKEEYSIGEYQKIKDDTRCELAARKIKDAENSCLIAIHIPEYKSRIWSLLRNGKKYDITALPLNVAKGFDWLSAHHKPARTYSWNSKHGENGKGAHQEHGGEKVSVLLCSKEHAAQLLPRAIGTQTYDFLYCYDADYSKYMEYKAECKLSNLPPNAPDRKYHSYHLDTKKSIPERILRKMRTLGIIE